MNNEMRKAILPDVHCTSMPISTGQPAPSARSLLAEAEKTLDVARVAVKDEMDTLYSDARLMKVNIKEKDVRIHVLEVALKDRESREVSARATADLSTILMVLAVICAVVVTVRCYLF